MSAQMNERRAWAIDQRLAGLVGCPVRVRAEQFMPKGWDREPIQSRNLILPDGTKVEHEPIYCEGVLKRFTRRVAVVFVELETLPFDGPAEGRVLFRGEPVVILRAPVTVQLHSSHFVEKLPANEEAYWEHLTAFDLQMRLPFIG